MATDCWANNVKECVRKEGCRWFSYSAFGGCPLCEKWFQGQEAVTGCRDWDPEWYCNRIFTEAMQQWGMDPSLMYFRQAIRHYGVTRGSGEPGNPELKEAACSVWCDPHGEQPCFGQLRAADEIKGVNYGGRFIPEQYLRLPGTEQLFDGIEPLPDTQLSLCDVGSAMDASERMSRFLNRNIQEAHFVKMQESGFNVVRLPLGYWNVMSLPEDLGPVGGTGRGGKRWLELQRILPVSVYKQWIDKVFHFAKGAGLKILLDLHGAPGSQTNNRFTGCDHSGGHFYFNTAWNKLLAIWSISNLSAICREHLSVCYGIEMLNEPDYDISRSDLRDFYQEAILSARRILPANVPIVVMDWTSELGWWKEQRPFSYVPHGRIMFSTHVYEGSAGPDVIGQQDARSIFANDVALIGDFHDRSPYEIFVSEYSLTHHGAGDKQDQFDYTSLGSWFVHQFNQRSAGSMLWNFDGIGAWGPVWHPVGKEGTVAWASIFADPCVACSGSPTGSSQDFGDARARSSSQAKATGWGEQMLASPTVASAAFLLLLAGAIAYGTRSALPPWCPKGRRSTGSASLEALQEGQPLCQPQDSRAG